MKVLDTDLLVGILRGSEDAKKAIALLGDEELYTTTITAFELYMGAFISSERERNLLGVDGILSSLSILSLDHVASKLSAEEFASLKKAGKLIGFRDCLIGGICLAHNAELLTRNLSEFSRIRKLSVRKW